MAPAPQQRGRAGADGKAERVKELLGMLEWAAYDRLMPVQLTLMEQLTALGEAVPEEGPLAQRLFLAGLDEVAATAETQANYDTVLNVLDSNPEVFDALGREGKRVYDEARVSVMRQAAAAALRACFGRDIEDPALDPRALSVADVDLMPYWLALDHYFPKQDPPTPGSALRGRTASPAAAAASSAAETAEDQDDAFRKELMRTARRELNSVTEGPSPCIAKCQVVLGRARKPAFVADIRAMTKRIEMALLGKPAVPRAERGQDPAGAGRRMEGSASHWPQGKSAGASAQEFHKQSRGHMRTLLMAAREAAETETDTEDEGDEHGATGKRGGGAQGRGYGAGRPRYNDPSRPGRVVSFEDSQYHGEESDSDSEDEEDGLVVARRPPSSHDRSAAAATRRASAALKRKRKAEQGEDSDVDEEVASPGSSDFSDSDSSDADGGGAGGGAAAGAGAGRGKKGAGGKPFAGSRSAAKRKQVGRHPTILGVSRRVVPKRKRVQWRDEEVTALEEAIQAGFMGDWAGILKHKTWGPKFDPSRTSVDLKDKWRNLERAKNRTA